MWALAKGGDMTIDDSNAPTIPKIKSNKPSPNPDGSHRYVGPEEAIKLMTVARRRKGGVGWRSRCNSPNS